MLESASIHDKKLWPEAVLTSVYIKNQQPHSALKDRTPYEAFCCTKASIQHLQPFGRECYIHLPYQKQTDAKKLSPMAQRAIFTEYTNMHHHYPVFSPDTKKIIVSADIFFPPLKSEGVMPMINRRIDQILTPLPSNTRLTSVEYTYNDNGKTSDSMCRDLMDKNPQEANDLVDNGHPTIARLIKADFEEGKRDRYLGAPYWVYDANNRAYREALAEQPNEEEQIEEFNESIPMMVTAHHFLEEKHHNPNQ